MTYEEAQKQQRKTKALSTLTTLVMGRLAAATGAKYVIVLSINGLMMGKLGTKHGHRTR